jgi:hypothetical protein
LGLYDIRMGAQELERIVPRGDTVEAQEGVQRPWSRKVFGE